MLASPPSFKLSPRQLAEMTQHNPASSRELAAVSWGHLHKLPKQQFSQYCELGTELSVQENCLFKGSGVVILTKAKKEVLDLAHTGHRGVVAMKAHAWGYFWWPGVDSDIERLAKSCVTCRQLQKAPPKVPFPNWNRATKLWHTILADLAGPMEGNMLPIVADAYSKWLEVCSMLNIQSVTLNEELWNLFATFGIPEMIVTEDRPLFRHMSKTSSKEMGSHILQVPQTIRLQMNKRKE